MTERSVSEPEEQPRFNLEAYLLRRQSPGFVSARVDASGDLSGDPAEASMEIVTDNVFGSTADFGHEPKEGDYYLFLSKR